MRLKVLIVSFILSVPAIFAQARLGVETGVNISHGSDTNGTRLGFNAGVTGEYVFENNWFMSAALKLTSQPTSFNNSETIIYSDGTTGIVTSSGRYTPYYMMLPINAGYRFNVSNDFKLYLGAGPMVGLGLFEKDGFKKYSDSRLEYGLNGKLTGEFKSHYRLGFEYNWIYTAGNNKAMDLINLFSINVGYSF